jgi:glycogen debranching enzyme
MGYSLRLVWVASEGIDVIISGTMGEGDLHHIVADSSVTDDRSRVLKFADTFAVFDHFGNMNPGGLGEEGLYHQGTRYLSCLILELDGKQPFFLGSTVRDANDQLSISLTNPDKVSQDRVTMPLGTLHLAVRTFLVDAGCHWQVRVRNHGLFRVKSFLALHFRADYADIYEVRGMKRKARGRDLLAEITSSRIVLGYIGLDNERRRTLLQFHPDPVSITPETARFDIALEPKEEITIELTIRCCRGESLHESTRFEEARSIVEVHLDRTKREACRVWANDGRFDAWIRRAESDLHMMITELPTGPYPYAGVPWFNTPFGRDGIITALECLWFQPELARGVLSYLAETQATEIVKEQDAEPGKILHETRNGEMAILREMPFAKYYGTADATPLFVFLAGAYFERTADSDFIESIWPNILRALDWIDRYGDLDKDGFVEYARKAEDGLVHQGWKDSDDAISHQDGSLARGPIAVCEIQGYVYAAKRAGAMLANTLGFSDRAEELNRQADRLQEQFDRIFWCDDLGTYALALDGKKQLCRVRSSNAGQCLFTGIAYPERVARLAPSLMTPEFFSGWGIRTLSSTEMRYNPMSYHNGSVWPQDNALIAYGFSRYGYQDLAVQVLTGLFESGTYFDLNRMPELFCGFARDPAEGPIAYPVACAPQAWAAGSVFLLLQSCLGMGVNGIKPQVWFTSPKLPDFLNEVRITNLSVVGATLDLGFIRHGEDVVVKVLRREGNVEVVVAN